MLILSDPRWEELENFEDYTAEELTDMISRLDQAQLLEDDHPVWVELWRVLGQPRGEPCTAAFAVVPHMVEYISNDPHKAPSAYFLFPTWVEIGRVEYGTVIPCFLRSDYHAALETMAGWAMHGRGRSWGEKVLTARLAACASGCGNTRLAKLILKLDSPASVEQVPLLALPR